MALLALTDDRGSDENWPHSFGYSQAGAMPLFQMDLSLNLGGNRLQLPNIRTKA